MTTTTITTSPHKQLPSPSPSPTRSHFNTPLKHDPNPHPYAIKTTSTGLLTRSNSSPHSAAQGRHYYVPLSSPSGSRSRKGSMSSDSDNGRDNIPSPSPSTGHRYTRSLNSDIPASLPIPPPSPTRSLDDDSDPIPLIRRHTTNSIFSPLSSTRTLPTTLPPNPKQWTPTQLSTYLSAALLRSQSGETLVLPDRVAKDIAAWVKEKGIGGRTFLELDEGDLEVMHLSTLWRTALLSASHSLRQEILKGSIYVDSSSPAPSQIIDDDDSFPSSESQPKLNCSQSNSPSSAPCCMPPFEYESPYAEDAFQDLDGLTNNSGYHFSPPTSTSSVDLSFASNLALGGEKQRRGGRRYKYRTVGRSGGRTNGKGGKVRGMVESWERSGSESEGGGDVAEQRPVKVATSPSSSSSFKPTVKNHATTPPPPAPSSLPHPEPQPTPMLPQEPPASHDDDNHEEEPSIETLLSQSQSQSQSGRHDSSWGARAWEEFDIDDRGTAAANDGSAKGLVTVKRVPVVPDSRLSADKAKAKAKTASEDVDNVGGKNMNVNGSVRRVLPGSNGKAIVGWEDGDGDADDDDNDNDRHPYPRPRTMKHLPVLPADDTHTHTHTPHSPSSKKGNGSVRSNAKGSAGREVGKRRVVTAIFSAEPDPVPVSLPVHDDDIAEDKHLGTADDPAPVSTPVLVSPPIPPAVATATAREAAEITTTDPSMDHESELVAEPSHQQDEELRLKMETSRSTQDLNQSAAVQLEDQHAPGPVELVEEGQRKQKQAELELELEREKGLEAELMRTKALVEAFRTRLERLEKKVEDMEETDRKREREERARNTRSRSISLARTPTSTTASTGVALITKALSYIYTSTSTSSSTASSTPPVSSSNAITLGRERKRRRADDPPVSALPSYVLLISIGMCAVVLRVVLKRVVKGTKG